jgi:hypothetical protein
MGRRVLFPFRFYGALRRLKHRASLPKIEDGAQKILCGTGHCFLGSTGCQPVLFGSPAEKPVVQFKFNFAKIVVGKLPTTAG